MIWNTLQAGDEGTAQEALELFIEVAEAHPRFLRKNLTEIVNAMLQVGPDLNHGTPDVVHLVSDSLQQMRSDQMHTYSKCPEQFQGDGLQDSHVLCRYLKQRNWRTARGS